MTRESDHVAPYAFVSYASVDRERALRVADLLEARGVSVWIDRKSIVGGASWSGEIVRAIRACATLVVACSSAAMLSPNVQQEIQLAWETRRPILPLLLEAVDLPDAVQYALAGRQWIEVLDRSEDIWLPRVVGALRGFGIPAPAGLASTGAPVPTAGRSLISLAGPIRPRTNLPAQTTAFLGREREVAAARQELLAPEVRLMTLTGPGGVGKTRLALALAGSVQTDFPDGVFFVPLAPVRDATLVLTTIAQVLDVRESATRSLLASLTSFFDLNRCLLLLDNFEQVASAVSDVGQLLAACPTLKILVTSRSALRAYGEHEFPVDPLALPDVERALPLDRLAQYDAIRLFVERARGVKPDFALTSENVGAVAEICRRLDGLPLAIEMAAARVRLLPPAALLARLERRLPLLTGGAKDLPERQQTLRGTIDWSYDLLDEAERRLFRRLSVFVGGFTLEATEATCAAPGDHGIDLVDGLDLLVGKSLVRPRDSSGESFFTLLETLREYGLERLAESGEAETVRAAHAVYYRSLAEQAMTGMIEGAQAIWVARLDRELGNVRAALTWALSDATPGDPALTDIHQIGEPFRRTGLALGIASALYAYWTVRGYQREGCAWIERALARSDPTERSQLRAKALLVASSLASQQGDSTASATLVEESVAIAREIRDKGLLAEALSAKGLVLLQRNDAAGLADLDESVSLFREVGDTFQLALTLFLDGDALLDAADTQTARARLAESVALFRGLANPIMVTLPAVSLGRLAWLEGDYPTAQSLIEEALATRRAVGDKWPLAGALSSLADVARGQGDQERAALLAEESLTLYRDSGDTSGTAWTLSILGHVARSRGDHARAQALFAESLALRDQQHRARDVAQCLAWSGGVAVATGQFTRAATLFGAANARLQPLGARWSPADQASYERDQETARTNLGQGQYSDAWNAGHTISTQNAIELASRSVLR